MSPISLVSQGTIAASGSPAFGVATTAGNLLVAWVSSNGSTSSATITTTASGWAQADAGGQPFGWASVWYKPNCGSGETAPVFTDPNGSVTFSQLAEYQGAATVSPVDQHGNAIAGGGNSFWQINPGPDVDAGDLVAVAGFWNGANPGGTISVVQFTDSASAAISSTFQHATSGSGPYLNFSSLWGIAGNTGNAGDNAFQALSVFAGGSGAMASFKPASPVSHALAVPAQLLPYTWLNFPFSTRTLLCTGGVPPYTWSVTGGSLPPGMSLSAAGVLSGTVTSAGTFSFTVQVTDNTSATASAALSVQVKPAPPGTSLTTTSSLTGALGPYPADPGFPPSTGFNTYVNANFVNPTASYSQTVGAYNGRVFYVTPNAGPPGTGQVQMGPSCSQQWNTWGTAGWNGSSNTPLSVLSSLTGTFDVTDPPGGGGWELAFDIWTGYTNTNTPGVGSPQDVMIWMDTPPERALANAAPLWKPNVTINGFTYDVYGTPFGGEMIFALQGPGGTGTYARMTSGTVDILGPLNYLADRGFNLGSPAPYLTLILFGWEICNTDVLAAGTSVQTEVFISNNFYYSASLAATVPRTPVPAGIVNRAVTIGTRIG